MLWKRKKSLHALGRNDFKKNLKLFRVHASLIRPFYHLVRFWIIFTDSFLQRLPQLYELKFSKHHWDPCNCYSVLSNIQIQIHKNTNTAYMCQKYPTYAIFLNSWWFKDVKNDNPKCSDPRYTVDFCTVPQGLFWIIFILYLFENVK